MAEPEVVPVTVLRTMPGDVLVITLPVLIPQEQQTRIRRNVKQALPNLSDVFIVTPDFEFSIIRNGSEVEPETVEPVYVELPK